MPIPEHLGAVTDWVEGKDHDGGEGDDEGNDDDCAAAGDDDDDDGGGGGGGHGHQTGDARF